MHYVEELSSGIFTVRNSDVRLKSFPRYKSREEAELQCSYLNGGLHPTTQKALAKVLNAGLREIENK